MTVRLLLSCSFTVIAVLARPGLAQFDEEADLIPGLVAKYTVGDRSIERIDVDLSHDWSAAAPDPRLPEGAFTAEWSTGMLLREEGTYTFHAYVQGAVSVEVDGETVLESKTDQPRWVSGEPVELDFGLLELNVTFRKMADAARMQVYWSSDRFPLEPLPPHQMFREEGRSDLAMIETGRQLFAVHRCNRCHVRDSDPPAPPGPELTHVTTGLANGWLQQKLLDQTVDSAHAKMPSFGFSDDEADVIAAWLASVAEPVELTQSKEPKRDKGDDAPTIEQAGNTLLHSVGCLGCHKVGELGENGPFGGGDLSHIGAKHTADWFNTWLDKPERLNAQHRMPVFKLSTNERALLAKSLSGLHGDLPIAASDKGEPNHSDERLKRGRELVKAARCAACHKIPQMEADVAGLPPLTAPVTDWTTSCLATKADRQKNRPYYPRIDSEAVRAYVQSHGGELSPLGPLARGMHVLEERNCLGCHERDLFKGIVPTAGAVAAQTEGLRGQSQGLIPPALTAVGDKLYDEPLAIAVSGEQKQPRLPWLAVRMPKFQHSDADKQALVEALIGHDRIPDGAPESTPAGASARDADEPINAQTLVTGRTLTGSGGFNCVACHKFGDYEPRNVALGTKGSDLKQIDKHLRPEFFHRWTRDPLRVVPGMEMPSIKRPVEGVLDGDLNAQLAAVWAAINDPGFTAPPNPAQVEQLLVLQPGDSPRLIRDVFTVSDANGGGYVARGLAMGFDNGHSLLFDLDNFCIRGWTFGDFAQQRTEGKSWYWDLAGVEPVDGFDLQPDVTLVPASKPSENSPSGISPKSIQLINYSTDEQAVRVNSQLVFEVDGRDVPLRVVQLFRPWVDERMGAKGIARSIAIDTVPGKMVAQLSIDRLQGPKSSVIVGEAVAGDETLPVRDGDPDWKYHAVYASGLSQTPLSPKPRPEFPRNDAQVTTLPGFTGQRLKVSSSIMPTAIGWTSDGRTAFTSLKGDVFIATDSDDDGVEDTLLLFEEGLAAPFGILAEGDSLLVAHKPELLRLTDTDDDGRADLREVVAAGWGYTDNYHDWTTGPVRDSSGNLYLGIGSDYSQPERPLQRARWRGKILKVDTSGYVEPIAHELRYPQGIAIDDQDRVFVTDQQGVANTFNEINYIIEGRHYGVEAAHEENRDAPETRAAVQVPHPWTRSVNGLMFLPRDITGPLAPYGGHALAAEYNSKFLIRSSFQEVDGELQGATYYFTRPTWDDEANTFLGPMSVALGPTGDLYVGSIHDSGWLGGQNTGEIVRLSPNGEDTPNGIRELRATTGGFEIEFLKPIKKLALLTNQDSYSISGYTRVWEGSYATPDSGRYSPKIKSFMVSDDQRTVAIKVDELRPSYLYEVNCTKLDESLFPATGYYTMNRIPQ